MEDKKMKGLKFFATAAVAVSLLSGCLEQAYPTSIITEEQLGQSSNALAALSRASAASLNAYFGDYSGFGYPGIMMYRDAMCAEIPTYATDYDYFFYYPACNYLGNYTLQSQWWGFFYKVILNSNLYISAAANNTEASVLLNLGNAYCYRAFAYLDLARMYEYHETGFPEIDDEAVSRGIMGLTVPIYTENTTEKDAEYLERAPFYALYRFILTDLDKAEELLKDYTSSSINTAGASLVYALKARTWLELASRFDDETVSTGSSDLSDMIAHENDYPDYDKMGVTSAKECYELAQKYAALAKDGHTPVSQTEWYNASSGFNTATSAWIFGIMVGSEDVEGSWKSFTANMSPETSYGTANKLYQGYRMIDANLYSKIQSGDWRKGTWIAPSDAGKTSAYSKYVTNLDEADFALCPALTNFKWHPAGGDMDNYLEGNVVDIPIIRVEEMYLIEAEAKAHTEGLAAGKAALKSFLDSYRFSDGSSYTSDATDMASFNREILTQKRIELWGEGVVYFDYKRLRIAVTRGYKGTNFPTAYQYNSIDGYAQPWSAIYITSSEYQYNRALEGKNNPDPSGIAIKWTN